MERYSNHLTISHRGKGIPYGGSGIPRDDGNANYGFKCLKGNDAAHQSIPELAKDPALLELALAINAPHTGLFSVGCLSAHVDDEHGFRDTGYMEFAFNSRTAIADASVYFPVFFHFDRFLYESGFPDAVYYLWELSEATFLEADHCAGFTCSVLINTDYSATRTDATRIWNESLRALGFYLAQVHQDRDDLIYSTQS